MRPAAIAVLAFAASLLLDAGPAQAHSEGLTPYRYVVAPAGVRSLGLPETGRSVQKLERPGFAGTTDNQMQLTIPARALPAREGEQGVEVTLEQLDPAHLPRLPAGLEPEGNGYRVSMRYAASKRPLARLTPPGVLGLSAPAQPTALYELGDGTWRPARYTATTTDEGFTSVVKLHRPGTFLQAYDPAKAPTAVAANAAPSAPPAARPPSSSRSKSPKLFLIGGGLLLAILLLASTRRRGEHASAGPAEARTD